MKYLTKVDILNSDDLEKQEVSVPEWGGTVLVRGMTGTERDLFEATSLQQNGKDYTMNFENLRSRLVAKCIIDEDGKRLFSDSDVAALGKKSAAALDRVFTVAQKLCGIGKDDLNELIKNSEPGQSENSTSD